VVIPSPVIPQPFFQFLCHISSHLSWSLKSIYQPIPT
jgi:hypothetical protein